MSENWRRKRYYQPRVLIDTNRVLSSDIDDTLICLTGPDLEMLRNLTQYLHRHSTFVSEYHEQHYTAPSNDEWDELQAIVAELEDKLMGCENIVTQLQNIALALQQLNQYTPATPTMLGYYSDEGYLQVPDDYGDLLVEVDAERCAIAQLCWSFAWELLTETIQPAQAKAMDVLFPLAMGAIASWVGTTELLIPTGSVFKLIDAAVDVYTEGKLMDVANSLYSARQELICAVYEGIETSARSASAQAGAVIEELPGWSPIDIMLGKLMYSPWIIDRMALAWDNQTAWATNNVDPGQCIDCEEPIIGSDWIAYRLPVPLGDVVIDHTTPGAYWEYGNVCHAMPDLTLCGAVIECVAETGDCSGGPTAEGGGSCGQRWTQNASSGLTLGIPHYYYKVFTHNDAEAISVLSPSALAKNEMVQQSGPTDGMASFSLGWNCTGTRTYRVHYLVYEYTP